MIFRILTTKFNLLLQLFCLSGFTVVGQNIETIAGTGAFGFGGDGGPAASALLNQPSGITIDKEGNIYIADYENYYIRKIDVSGNITSIAGTGINGYSGDDVPASTSQLDHPYAVTLDKYGNIYIADQFSHRIRKITKSTGMITTVAGNGNAGYNGDGIPATSAELWLPSDVAVDTAGNMYIADVNNNRIRKVTAATGIISTIAGTGTGGYSGDGGPAVNAKLWIPYGICLDSSANLYIADYRNCRIRKVIANSGNITTIAGTGVFGFDGDGGPAAAAKFEYPSNIVMDLSGNIYVSDFVAQRVRKIDVSSGIINSIAGTGSAAYDGDGIPAANASLNYPTGLAVDPCGIVYIADQFNNRIRKITNPSPVLSASDPLTICSGTSSILSVSGGKNYTWIPLSGLTLNTGNIVTAHPDVTTTYSVFGSCSSSASVKITVNSITVNAGQDAVVCSGSSTQLNASSSVSGTLYEWRPAYALSATTGASVSSGAMVSTSYSLTVTDANGCKNTDEVLVSVSVSLTSNGGADVTICKGNSTTLNGSGGSDYVWSPAENLDDPTIFNPAANPTATTTFTLQAQSGPCPTLPDVVNVVVKPYTVITISGSPTICSGRSTMLSATDVSFCLWSPSSGLNSETGTVVTASPFLTTTYSVNGANECGTSEALVTVNVLPDPSLDIGGSKTLCKGESIALSASGASVYSWSPASSLDTTTGIMVNASPTVNTFYYLTGIDDNGCKSSINTFIIVYPCTEIEESVETSSSTIYPNPNDGKFFIQLNSSPGYCELKITNAIGDIIISKKINTSLEEIDLSNQRPGIYFVKIYDQQERVTVKKIIIK